MTVHHAEGYVRAPGGLRLYWRAEGPVGATAVALCGAAGLPCACWGSIAARLSRWFRVVRWDYRGHGKSDAPADPTDLAVGTCARDLGFLLDALQLPRAALLGLGAGGGVARELTRLQPSRVSALVVAGGAGSAAESPLSTARRKALSGARAIGSAAPHLASTALRAALSPPGAAAGLARLLPLVGVRPSSWVEPLVVELVRVDPRTPVALAASARSEEATRSGEALPVPRLLVAGRGSALELSGTESRGGGTGLLIVPDGSIWALVAEPELLCLGIAGFLERVREAPSEADARRAG